MLIDNPNMPTTLEKNLLQQWFNASIELDPNSCVDIPDLYNIYCRDVGSLAGDDPWEKEKPIPVLRKSFSAGLKKHLLNHVERSSVRFFYYHCSKVEGIRCKPLM